MAQNYRTGIIITGDAKGGVKAAQLTDEQLKKLNATQKKGQKVQKDSRQETDKGGKSLKEYAGKFTLVASAASALVGVIGTLGLGAIVKHTVEVTRETTAWAAAVGVSTQEMQAANYAGEALGLSQGKIGDIYKDTADKIADAYLNGSATGTEALRNLNLTASDLIKLSPDKQLLAIAHGLDQVGSKGAKVQILESLSSDASLLAPLLANDGEQLKALKAEAIKAGVAMSDLDTAKIKQVDNAFRKAAGQATGLGNQLTIALAPIIVGISKDLSDQIDKWGGLDGIAKKVVDGIVTGLGWWLDTLKQVTEFLLTVEIVLLDVGKAGVDAFVNTGQAGVDLLNSVLQPIRKLVGTIIEGWGYLVKAAADVSGNESWKKAAQFMLGYADAMKTTQLTMQDFKKLQKSMQDEIKSTQEELQRLVASGAPSDAIKKKLEEYRKEITANAQATLDAAKAADALSASQADAFAKAKANATEVAQLYKDVATSINSAFKGAFRDLLDGTNSFAQRMVGLFKDLLAQMATLAIARPIIIPMVSSIGGLLGVSADAQAQVVKQLGGGVLPTQAGGASAAGAAPAAAGPLGAAGTVLGHAFVGYMVGGAAAQIFNVANPGMTQNLTAIGAAIAGPIGGVVGFAVGSLLNGDWQTKAAGLDLSVGAGGFSGRTFQDQTKKGGLFSGDSSRTIYGALSSDLQIQLSKTFDQIKSDFTDMGDTLGQNASKVLSDFSYSAKINLQGLSDSEISAKINGWTQDIQNQLALDILPGLRGFQRAGEQASDTLKRLVDTLKTIHSLDSTLANDIAVLTSTMTNSGIALATASEAIASTLDTLGNTSDVTDRVNLESQLRQQVLDRYNLEIKMLTDVQNAVTAASNTIAGLRTNISGDLSNISGTSNVRDIASIVAAVAAITPANAPAYNGIDVSGANASVGSTLTAVNTAQDALTSLQGQLGSLFDAVVGGVNHVTLQGKLDQYARNGLSVNAGLAADQLYASQNAATNTPEANATNQAVHDLVSGYISLIQTQIPQALQNITQAQTDYNTALADQSSLQSQADQALADYNSSLSDYVDLTNTQVDSLQSLRDQTVAYYQAQQQLDAAMQSAASNIGATLDRLNLSTLSPGGQLDSMLSQFRDLASSAGSASGYDLTNIASKINSLVDPLLGQASSLFASGSGYQDIFTEVTQSLSDIQSRLLSTAPVDYQQASIDALTSIDSLLSTIQSGLSAADQAIVDAIKQTGNDTVAVLQDIRSLLGGDTAAINGSHADGLARVPFDGYRATLHANEAVIDAGTMNSLRRYGIPTSPGANLLPVLERIANATENADGSISLKVVTPDGKTLKEETIGDIRRRSRRGEIMIYAPGVAKA